MQTKEFESNEFVKSAIIGYWRNGASEEHIYTLLDYKIPLFSIKDIIEQFKQKENAIPDSSV